MAQTDNFTLLSPASSDAATMTASQEATGGPVTNLQDLQPTRLWKSNNLTSVSIEVDMGAVSTINQVGLLFHNLTSSGTIQVRTADTQANLTAAPTQDETLEAYTQLEGGASDLGDAFDLNHFFIHRNPAWSNRWVRLDFSDGSNPAGFFSAGRLVIGNAWQSPMNLSQIRWPGYIDISDEVQTLSNRTYMVERPKRRTLSGRLRFSEESDYLDNFDELMRLRGGNKDVLFCLKPTETLRRHKRLIYGKMRVETASLEIGSTTRYSNTINIAEII